MSTKEPAKTGLALLREPFPAHQIGKLPKPTKAQTDAVRNDFKAGIRCNLCGAWHHPQVVHLDYVGHAALTDRLLDADPAWSWEPMALGDDGLPLFDQAGGLWIKLTVCGVTRLGYGNADAKSNSDAGAREKEVIGDALRNAALRFGAALEFWHKGELHVADDAGNKPEPKEACTEEQVADIVDLLIKSGVDREKFLAWLGVANPAEIPSAKYRSAMSALQKRIAKNDAAANVEDQRDE